METKRQYEVVFIVDPSADDDEVTRLTDSIKQIATDQGGTVTKAESMGRRRLAYEILHKTEGNFVLLEIEGSGREIAELERRMRVNDRIIRYITVRVDEDRQRVAVDLLVLAVPVRVLHHADLGDLAAGNRELHLHRTPTGMGD